jgi:hypothetical protein
MNKFFLGLLVLTGATAAHAGQVYVDRTCTSADGQTLKISDARDYEGYRAVSANFEVLDNKGARVFAARNNSRSLNGNDYDYELETIINTFGVELEIHPQFPATIEDLVSSKEKTGVIRISSDSLSANPAMFKYFTCP